MYHHHTKILSMTLVLASALVSNAGHATVLHASSGGTFTFNYDSAALGLAAGGNANFNGYHLSNFWDSAASDFTNPANTASSFVGKAGNTQISATHLVHDITAVGANPGNQPSGRHVQGTSPNFSIDSTNLNGVTGAQLGMTGIQSFYAPLFGTRGHVTAGDFSLLYDPTVSSNSGWYIKNNFAFGLNLYDLTNLSITVADADNWQLTGDLLLTADYAGMIFGQAGTTIGNFNLGVGSYAVSSVPVPGAVWLFASALTGMIVSSRRKTA